MQPVPNSPRSSIWRAIINDFGIILLILLGCAGLVILYMVINPPIQSDKFTVGSALQILFFR
jgi:hypothetical protein